MEVIKIVMLGMTGMMLGLFLKSAKPEYSIYLSLAVGVLIFSVLAGKLSYLFSSVQKIQNGLSIPVKYLDTLLRMIGITYIGQFSASICKDAGYGAIGNQIEVFTKIYLMVLSMPVLLALLDTIQEILI